VLAWKAVCVKRKQRRLDVAGQVPGFLRFVMQGDLLDQVVQFGDALRALAFSRAATASASLASVKFK